MKPWFEKEIQEADIIKFPKPERKVIKMPSVSEYPDFITGVQDLQAREKKGQISKDTYDRLYSDLIQRFMKKESFETPWFLRELDDRAIILTGPPIVLNLSPLNQKNFGPNGIFAQIFVRVLARKLPSETPMQRE